MDYYDLKRLALIKAVEAELKGMVAENEYCKYNTDLPKYRIDDFKEIQLKFENLAYAHNEQL